MEAGSIDDKIRQSREEIDGVMKQIADAQRRKINADDDKMKVEPWLRRVGWAKHLPGRDSVDMLKWVTLPKLMSDGSVTLPRMAGVEGEADQLDATILMAICESFDRVIEQCIKTAVPEVIGLEALFEANKKEEAHKPSMPFESIMEPDTLVRYKSDWKKIICYIGRTYKWESRPGYKMTEVQGMEMDSLIEAAGMMAERGWIGHKDKKDGLEDEDEDEEGEDYEEEDYEGDEEEDGDEGDEDEGEEEEDEDEEDDDEGDGDRGEDGEEG